MSFMIPDNIEAILFDMDGTLVDTEPIGPKAFIEYFRSFNIEINQQELALFTKIWRREIRDYDQNDWLFECARGNNVNIHKEDFLEGFYNNYIELISQAKQLLGVDDLLNKLKKFGYKVGLVTASKRDQTSKILENNNWNDIFDIIVSYEDTVDHKPNPAPYLKGVEFIGTNADQTLVFEDSSNGIVSAKSAGCYVVGLRTGTDGQDLTRADIIIDNLTQVEI